MAVNATFGTVGYRENGGIAVPISFAEAVIAPSKSICEITYVSGDDLTGVDYRLIGEGTDHELVFEVPPDRVGSFSIDVTGNVFKVAARIYDNVTITPITVNYDTRVPRIVNYDIPASYTPGEPFDVRIAYSARVTGLSDNNVHQVFILEGAANMMGTPTPHKWIGDSPPDFTVAVPDDLTDTDWQQLASPPVGVPITAENDFDENGFWHGLANEGQYFLIRWIVTEGTTGVFNLTPREGTLRGPIGNP